MTILKAIALGYTYFKVKTSNGNSYLKMIKLIDNKNIIVKNYTTENKMSLNVNREIEPCEKINIDKISLENSMFSYGYKPKEKKQKIMKVRFKKNRNKK